MDPIAFCFRRVSSGDKTFSEFQKGRLKVVILKVSKPFLKHNKMERLLNGPIRFCFAESLRGIKHFQDFKKADNKAHFETSKYVPRQQPRQQ